jgi:RHH-type proline utilization regulon transcriptional repressor/proline dehydrogenase/delta 1-pyrroline-5-carboxylate dehydrogenase
MRYERDNLEDLLSSINRHGYGLTMGLHTRINETISKVASSAHVGNLYVNRNMVGATVGVQPFGGEGLSGTGPKAGGPLYLYRLLSKRPDEVLVAALSGLGTPSKSANSLGFNEQKAFKALAVWADQHNDDLAQLCSRFTTISALSDSLTLAGPTGELNIYNLVPRSSILCLANDNDRLAQLAAILAVGGQAVWPEQAASLLERLPAEVQARVSIVKDWTKTEFRYELVLLHGSTEELAHVQQQLARRDGAVISVERLQPGERTIPLERLVIERSLSVNIAAAGGNTSLMTLS